MNFITGLRRAKQYGGTVERRAFSLNPKLAHEADCGYEDRRVRISIVARSPAPQTGRIHFRRLLLYRLCSCSNAADHTFWVST